MPYYRNDRDQIEQEELEPALRAIVEHADFGAELPSKAFVEAVDRATDVVRRLDEFDDERHRAGLASKISKLVHTTLVQRMALRKLTVPEPSCRAQNWSFPRCARRGGWIADRALDSDGKAWTGCKPHLEERVSSIASAAVMDAWNEIEPLPDGEKRPAYRKPSLDVARRIAEKLDVELPEDLR